MTYSISSLPCFDCLVGSTMEPARPRIFEGPSFSEQLRQITAIAIRILTAFGAATTTLIFLASGSLVTGAVAVGLACVTLCLWPSSSTSISPLAQQRLHTTSTFTHPTYISPPAKAQSPILLFNAPSWSQRSEDRLPEWHPSPTVCTMGNNEARMQLGHFSYPQVFPSSRLHSSPLEERVPVGDHASLFVTPSRQLRISEEEERVQVGNRSTQIDPGNEGIPIRKR